ncbi:mechanosensitive ion channel family protein [Halosimplex salinum]|uniref:mechanosensitive ion channel family protein n=1 Tax=Halosimplex salinum TaxID=1710538 RepID=UPI000F49356C|nr:mechanosensitive ion channel family protein [Halosimplex salinum]
MFQATTTAESTRAFLEGFDTLGGRFGFTAALLVVVALVGWAIVPRLVDGVDGSAVQWAVGGAILRAVQFCLVVGGAVSLIYVWGFGSLVTELESHFEDDIVVAGRVLGSLFIFFAAYAGARFLSGVVANLGHRADWMTDHQEEIVLRTSQLLLFGFVGLVILGIWDANIGGLLVGAGFLGIVVGLAARQTLGSLIAGFVLMFSRPFTIGDWVQVGDEEGIVTDITIFNTRLENFDGEFVVLPNDSVADRAITNRSQKGLLRIRVDVGIDYAADPERAQQVAIEAISGLSEVVDAPPPQVFPKEFGDSSVILEMRFWIDHPTPPRKWKAVSSVISSVKAAFEAEGIKIPFPQRELAGRAESGGFHVRDTDGQTGNAEDATPEAHGND